MLPKPNRITDGTDYRAVVRRGARCSGANTVVYVLSSDDERAARFGFIVAKNVGNAVRRNAVRRRLKAVCAGALPGVRAGSDIVIRALPASASASFPALRAEVERCLERRAS
ncbi:ribonuclease P protein component [Microbacterium sp. X-17]|uniref:ribonuclease P protein component n=1 Tax=Microbacterium sp. X-17 TaxID=3144404 RepID=UPI0031F5A725